MMIFETVDRLHSCRVSEVQQIQPRLQFGDLHDAHFLELFGRAVEELGVFDAAGAAEAVDEPRRDQFVAGGFLVADDLVVQVAGLVDVRWPVVGADQVQARAGGRQGLGPVAQRQLPVQGQVERLVLGLVPAAFAEGEGRPAVVDGGETGLDTGDDFIKACCPLGIAQQFVKHRQAVQFRELLPLQVADGPFAGETVLRIKSAEGSVRIATE